MSTVRFLTHPDVVIDLAVPAPSWALSERGRRRIEATSLLPWVADLVAVWSSTEFKAVEAGQIVASAAGGSLRTRAGLGEIDRSATGPLSEQEHAVTSAEFFAHPQRSARGWERAIDAQDRIVGEVSALIEASPPGDIAIIAHGAVGTLLLCQLRGVPISRSADQPSQGHGFAFDRESRVLSHGWCMIEHLPPVTPS